ncbi:LOW QUALITY PROTEIN: uncharacterized protein C12orf60 homolog [Glossophaga mutica]
MSSESGKDKESLVQAAKTFFFHMQAFASFTNTLTKLFNSSMNNWVTWMVVKEDGYIEDVLKQMLIIFKEVQSVVDAEDDKMQKEPLFFRIGTAMGEKNANVKELHEPAKEGFKNVHVPTTVSWMNSANIPGSLESSLSLLMKYPIMNLQLSDFATTSEKSPMARSSKSITVDTVKKLQDALKTETTKNILS